MARALGALGHVAKIARGDVSSPLSGRGILVFRRNFPAWAYPADDVIRIERTWSLAKVGRRIKPRLRALVRREREAPSIAAATIKEWGL